MTAMWSCMDAIYIERETGQSKNKTSHNQEWLSIIPFGLFQVLDNLIIYKNIDKNGSSEPEASITNNGIY